MTEERYTNAGPVLFSGSAAYLTVGFISAAVRLVSGCDQALILLRAKLSRRESYMGATSAQAR